MTRTISNLITPKQADRFRQIAFNSNHIFRAWTPDEVDRLLRRFFCLDPSTGKPSYRHIPWYRNGIYTYNQLCLIVAGMVPDEYSDFTYTTKQLTLPKEGESQ